MFRRLRESYRRAWEKRAAAGGEASAGDSVPLPEVGDEEGEALVPPDSGRVSRRALCLAAVAARGLLEAEPSDETREMCDELQVWFREAGLPEGLAGEVEAEERAFVETPFGEAEHQGVVNACWRCEGLAVLCWALRRGPALPGHDRTVDPQGYIRPAGVMGLPGEGEAMHRDASLRPAAELEAFAARQLSVHWRLRQFAHIEQEAIDFAAFASGVDWGRFNLQGVELIEGDLALQGERIDRAGDDALGLAMSIAMERHKAANWLIGWDAVYSDVDTST